MFGINFSVVVILSFLIGSLAHASLDSMATSPDDGSVCKNVPPEAEGAVGIPMVNSNGIKITSADANFYLKAYRKSIQSYAAINCRRIGQPGYYINEYLSEGRNACVKDCQGRAAINSWAGVTCQSLCGNHFAAVRAYIIGHRDGKVDCLAKSSGEPAAKLNH